MTDENHSMLLTSMICVLLFLCAVATLTQHPHWFRVPTDRLDQASGDLTLPRATVEARNTRRR